MPITSIVANTGKEGVVVVEALLKQDMSENLFLCWVQVSDNMSSLQAIWLVGKSALGLFCLI